MLQRLSSRAEPWGHLLYSFEDDEFSAVHTGGEMIPSAPIGVGWVIIGGCNLICRHCYGNAEALPRRYLRGETVLEVADALVRSRVMRVVISGGEPLLHPDIVRVVRRLVDGGVSVILGTNGTSLTRTRLRQLRGCTRIELSLDGDTAAVNNEIRTSRRQRGDAFKVTRKAVANALQSGIRTRVLTTVNRINQDRLEGIAALLWDWGVRDWAVSWTLPAGRALRVYDELRPDADVIAQGLSRAVVSHPEMNIRYSNRATGYDRYYCLVLPDGTVATESLQLGEKIVFGSLLSSPLSSMWLPWNFRFGDHMRKWVGDRILMRAQQPAA